jgi:TorA maturation chaperone TorD
MTAATADIPPLDRPIVETLVRASMYRILSVAFAHPTAPRLDELRLAIDKVLATGAVASPVAGPLQAFREAVDAADAGDAAGEYVFLFDQGVRCAPYEGAYGPPKVAGHAAQLADVAGFYAAFGLALEGGQAEAADHVSAELEFMSTLALREAWALVQHATAGWQVTREAAMRFIDDHLARWAPAFADALEAATALPFYRTAACALRSWIAEERRVLGASSEPVAGPTPVDAEEAAPLVCPLASPDR